LPPEQLPATCLTEVTRRACAPPAPDIDPLAEPAAPAVEPVAEGVEPVVEPAAPVELGDEPAAPAVEPPAVEPAVEPVGDVDPVDPLPVP